MKLRWWVILGMWLLPAAFARAQDSFVDLWFQDLPNTGRVWSILENQAPWTVAEPLDTAGLQTGALPLFGALGASRTENRYLLNELNITDSYIPGRPLLDPHLEALAALDTVTISKPAGLAGSGTDVRLASPVPPEDLHGAAQVYWSGNALQSNSALSEQLGHVLDASFHAGGTPASAIPFFVSAFTQDLSKTLDGFPATITGNTYGLLAAATPRVRDGSRLDILYSGQHLFDSHAAAGPYAAPEATTRDTRNAHVFQTRLRSAAFETGFEFLYGHRTSAFQNDAGDAVLELPQRMLSGSAPLAGEGKQLRLEAYVKSQREVGRHHLDWSARYEWNSIRNRWEGHTQRILVDGIEEQILRWNAPGQTSAHVGILSLSLDDVWHPAGWLSVPVGLRFEVSRGGGISWTSLNPRTGVQVSIWDTLLLANWSRYGHLLQGRYLDFGNPESPGGSIYSGETLVSRFGGPYSEIDPGFKQPYADEIVAGMRQKFAGAWQVGVTFFRRDDHHMAGLLNTGVPPSAYIPVPVLDPGNDGIEGTADDNLLTLYDRDPSTFGQDFLQLTNPDGLSNQCKGFRIWIEKEFAGNWEFSVDFVGTRTAGTTNPGNAVWENDVGILGSLGTDPNTLVLARGTTFFDRGFIGKLTALRRWASGLRVGVVARYYDGLAFGRLLFVPDFNQGPFFVRATPRDDFPKGFRTEFNATLDVRLAQAFGRWRVAVDCFNLLNLNRNIRESDLTSPRFASRIPLMTQAPRAFRLGLQYRF